MKNQSQKTAEQKYIETLGQELTRWILITLHKKSGLKKLSVPVGIAIERYKKQSYFTSPPMENPTKLKEATKEEFLQTLYGVLRTDPCTLYSLLRWTHASFSHYLIGALTQTYIEESRRDWAMLIPSLKNKENKNVKELKKPDRQIGETIHFFLNTKEPTKYTQEISTQIRDNLKKREMLETNIRTSTR